MDKNAIKPPFSRQGNKFKLRDKIISFIPPHQVYIELFAGSGAIFFSKEKANTNVLNDLDKSTYNSFKMIQKAPLDVESYPDVTTIEDAKVFFDKSSHTRIQDKLALYKIKTSCGFGNTTFNHSKDIYNKISIRNWAKLIPVWKEKLKDTTILNEDYQSVVKKYNKEDTFFFIDPPYENTSKSFGYAEDTDFDFNRLLEVLKTIKGFFMMTINDSPNIRKIFSAFNIFPILVQTPWSSTKLNPNTKRKELIITNYIEDKK